LRGLKGLKIVELTNQRLVNLPKAGGRRFKNYCKLKKALAAMLEPFSILFYISVIR